MIGCEYCDKQFEPKYHLSKYCSKLCSKRMHKIKKRIQQKKMANTDEPRICKGCGKKFQFYNMRLYCKTCKEIRQR